MNKQAVLYEKIEIKSPTIESYRWASKVYSRLDATSFLIVLASADFLYQRQGTGATFFCLTVTSGLIIKQYVIRLTFWIELAKWTSMMGISSHKLAHIGYIIRVNAKLPTQRISISLGIKPNGRIKE